MDIDLNLTTPPSNSKVLNSENKENLFGANVATNTPLSSDLRFKNYKPSTGIPPCNYLAVNHGQSSWVWDYFTKYHLHENGTDPKQGKFVAVCKYDACRTKKDTSLIAHQNGTSGMKNHLMVKHHFDKDGKIVETASKSGLKNPIADAFSAIKVKNDFKHANMYDLLMKCIVSCDLPFSIVDHPAFRAFVNYLNINANIQSRRTLMRNLDKLYKKTMKLLRGYFKTFDSKISITCDVFGQEEIKILFLV